MSLENLVSGLSAEIFFKEFTFSQNKFSPTPGHELELADSILWMRDFLVILQLKERALGDVQNAESERKWFEKKVMRKAVSQIKDSLRFLQDNATIKISNVRGHSFEISGSNIKAMEKIVLYRASTLLPIDCRRTHHYVSSTGGFVHIMSVDDYVEILDTLVVPFEVRSYLAYRREILLKDALKGVTERAVIGHFIGGDHDELPTSESEEYADVLIQDRDQFDISPLLSNLHQHIVYDSEPYDYYEILLEFMQLPRSFWREYKKRLVRAIEVVNKGDWTRPFRLSYPPSDCAYMICPVDPEIVASPKWGNEMSIQALGNLTYAARYSLKARRAVGVVIAKEGQSLRMDWAHLKGELAFDANIEAALKDNPPFREASEREVYSYHLDDGS